MDLVLNCFPRNIVQATMQHYSTTLIYLGPGTIQMHGCTIKEMTRSEWSSSTNILGLVVFSIVTTIAIESAGKEGIPLLRFYKWVFAVKMKVTTWVIYLAPVGVLFLIVGQLTE